MKASQIKDAMDGLIAIYGDLDVSVLVDGERRPIITVGAGGPAYDPDGIILEYDDE